MNWLASAGIDRLQCREDDDEAEDLQALEAERARRLDLTVRDRLDAGTDDLARIGAEIDRHRGECRGVGGEADARSPAARNRR